MASSPRKLQQPDFILLGSKITVDGDCSHEIQRHLLLEGEAMTNLSVLSHCSPVKFSVTLWTVALQAPLSMRFSRQKYWSGLPCPSPGDMPNPGIKSGSPTLQADSLCSESPGKLKQVALARSQTQVNCLEGSYANHHTTNT